MGVPEDQIGSVSIIAWDFCIIEKTTQSHDLLKNGGPAIDHIAMKKDRRQSEYLKHLDFEYFVIQISLA